MIGAILRKLRIRPASGQPKAKHALAKQDRLLKIIAWHRHYRVGDLLNGARIEAVVRKDQKLAQRYTYEEPFTEPDMVSPGTRLKYKDGILLEDLGFLKRRGWISYQTQTSGQDSFGSPQRSDPGTWKVALTDEGLYKARELEKPRWKRAYDKNPAAWWQVALTAIAVGISIYALARTYGPPTPQPTTTTNAAEGSGT